MQDPNAPTMRPRRPNDINTLQKLDAQAYPYPMPLDEWQAHINREENPARIVIVDVMHIPVAFGMWAFYPDENLARILRLGVQPSWRRNSIGSVILGGCIQDCEKNGEGIERLSVVVPHLNCRPGDPDDVSAFLTKHEFRATGEIIEDWCRMYGEWIDGYVFERPVNVTQSV